MRRTLSRILLATLVMTACRAKQQDSGTNLSTNEDTSTRVSSTSQDDSPPPEEEDKPDDGESGGAGTAMALDEGKLGKKDGVGDQSLGRAQAVESARQGGLLGAEGQGNFGYGRSGHGAGGGGTGDTTIGTGRYGTIGKGTGTGQGYGAGAGRGGMRGRVGIIDVDPRGSEGYTDYGKNTWTEAAKDHLSTFAADVDTASYTLLRRKLVEGVLPPNASVRVEELVNYFKYAYAAPSDGERFSVAMNMVPSPFESKHHILRVGVSTKPLAIAQRKQANLVFLVDVSGSMQGPDRLPLAQRSLRILVDNLKDGDTVALVTYAGNTRVVLPPTGIEHRNTILSAIEDLTAGGSTAMGDGIKLAYQQAAKGLRPNAESRVIVLSDGDANVGNTTHEQILQTIKGHVKEGVTLSTIGFGTGNYKDGMMEQLANKGNGNNFYIDGLSAAKRVFQEQLGATLEVVAKDVKLQVDFDKSRVSRYRLIGYENRDVKDQDFRNDKVDAGEIGAGHQVTALYEVELAKGWASKAEPLATVRVRHKQPRAEKATEAAFPMALHAVAPSFAQATADMRFAFAVAAFADVMRGGQDAKTWDLKILRDIAKAAAGQSEDRKELVSLIDRAITLRDRTAKNP
jgi:Ca-activated chloride channel family protein